MSVSGLEAIEKTLVRIVGARDGASLRALLSPTVVSSFGGDPWVAEFAREWAIDDPRAEFWSCLRRVLRLGGARESGFAGSGSETWVYPYVATLDLADPERFFDVLVVTGARVRIRSGPSTSHPAIVWLQHAVLTWKRDLSIPFGLGSAARAEACTEFEWARVETPGGGTSGYVNWQYAYGPVGPRLYLQRVGDRWTITAFVSGD